MSATVGPSGPLTSLIPISVRISPAQPGYFVLLVKRRIERENKAAGSSRKIESQWLKAKSRLDPFSFFDPFFRGPHDGRSNRVC